VLNLEAKTVRGTRNETLLTLEKKKWKRRRKRKETSDVEPLRCIRKKKTGAVLFLLWRIFR